MRALYLHGFGSGPTSRKANWLRDTLAARHGLDLALPQLVRGPFRDMTLTEQLESVDALLAGEDGPALLVGSSMGGYVAALYAAANPNKPLKLALLAPAFGFPARWLERLAPEELEHWRTTGEKTVYHHANDQEEPIGYQLVMDAERYPDFPVLPASVPAVLLHGTRDETVPHHYSETYLASNPHASLVSLDDDHSLLDSLDTIAHHVGTLLGSSPPGSASPPSA